MPTTDASSHAEDAGSHRRRSANSAHPCGHAPAQAGIAGTSAAQTVGLLTGMPPWAWRHTAPDRLPAHSDPAPDRGRPARQKRITATIQIPQNRLGDGRGLPPRAGILAGRASRRRQRLRGAGDGRGSARRRRARRRPAHRSGQPSTPPGPSGRPASGFPSPSPWAVPGPLSITRSSNRGTPPWSSSCGRGRSSPRRRPRGPGSRRGSGTATMAGGTRRWACAPRWITRPRAEPGAAPSGRR